MLFKLKSALKIIKNYEIGRFLIIGITTVIIDLVIYLLLFNIIVDSSISKSISFSVGAVFAYFANRSFTFKASMNGFFRFSIFILLYLSTLFVNVVTNEILLNLMNLNIISILIAFMIATSFSAGLNFFGMKYIVFSSIKGKKL